MNINSVLESGFFVMAGNCIIENEETTLETAQKLKEICVELELPLIYKTSFYKANRTSMDSYTGPDNDTILRALNWVKDMGHPIISDVHTDLDIDIYSGMIDMLQIPAFLCRQTELLIKAGQTGKPVMIKKGQFMDPHAMKYAVEKVAGTAGTFPRKDILLCERGSTFGYNNLVVDMRSLQIMSEFAPVVFDATHSTQQPGGKTTAGGREFVPLLARAATAVGIAGIFIETHPNPAKALSDAATQWPLGRMHDLLYEIKAVADMRQRLSIRGC